MDIKQGKRSRHSFLGLRFMRRIPGVGFEWNILLKGVCGLGFEGIKDANML
ncbi:hypothetical protein [uncultured Campylobacter sp.]|uniref:hypothetical protein n=1 Tax=uncultured Campylobacter sp. TaxID=218934 RepID=UPI002627AD08|nr:hypothetical protein [uncultured Campylobacter sp.]